MIIDVLKNDQIYVKNINYSHLSNIQKWCNNTKDSIYVTGVDTFIDKQYIFIDYLKTKLRKEFYYGIFENNGNNMIGFLKWGLKTTDVVWIYSILISHEYRNRCYGRMALNLLFDNLRQNSSAKKIFISVMCGNTKGFRFWINQGFRVRKIIKEGVIGMEKLL